MASKIDKFVDSKITNEFSLTISQVAKGCKNDGRFKAWLNSDISKIERILKIVKENGISPAFFAAYERSEGYNSKFGWLNHTYAQSDYYKDAEDVTKVVVSESKNPDAKPSWIDYGNPVDFVPESVKEEGNTHFKNLEKGRIGRAVIPLTAAATWGTYYPKGLKKEYNKIQTYANPIKTMADAIIEWGGSFDGKEPPPDPDPDPPAEPDVDVNVDISKLLPKIEKTIKDNLENDLFKSGNSQYYQNNFIKLVSQLENTFKTKINTNFFKTLKKVFDDFVPDIDVDISYPDPEPEPDPIVEKVFPVNKKADGVNFWFPPYADDYTHNMDYGTRTNGGIHAGYDIGAGGNANIKVHSVVAGEVHATGYANITGYYVDIKSTNDDYYIRYQHLKKDSTLVKKGDKVKAGTPIATMGDTGGNYPIHLHISLSKTAEFYKLETTTDPKPYLKITGDNKTELPSP